MHLASLLILEVPAPKVKLTLPPLRQGDRIKLNFKLERILNGRAEILSVVGEYRVSSVSFAEDFRQEVSVESTGKAPAWRAVKKTNPPQRKLGPCLFPPTKVS